MYGSYAGSSSARRRACSRSAAPSCMWCAWPGRAATATSCTTGPPTQRSAAALASSLKAKGDGAALKRPRSAAADAADAQAEAKAARKAERERLLPDAKKTKKAKKAKPV